MNFEKMRTKPNLARIAAELSSYGKDADRVVDGLMFVLAARAKKSAEPAPATADNNQRFNDPLNRCKDPQRTFNALLAFAEGRKAAVQK